MIVTVKCDSCDVHVDPEDCAIVSGRTLCWGCFDRLCNSPQLCDCPRRGFFLCEHEELTVRHGCIAYSFDNLACEPPALVGRVCLWLSGLIHNLAERGTSKALAMGFTEYALDAGPVAFLSNRNSEMAEVEVQVLGKAVFHAAY